MARITLKDKERLQIISNFGTMLQAGIPILEVVEVLHSEAKGNAKKVLASILLDLSEGRPVADSIEKLPDAFDPVTVSLIRSGERSGNLPEVLKNLKVNIKKNIVFKSTVLAALTYPILVFFLFIAIVLLMFLYVIPRISKIFFQRDMELPILTRIVFGASDIFRENWIVIIILSILLIGGFIAFYTFRRRVLINFLFSLPVLSKLGNQMDVSRFFNAMSFMLTAGVPIITALELAKHVVSKKSTEKSIDSAIEALTSGLTLRDGFKQAKTEVFSGSILKIIDVGERSGTLDISMAELSEEARDTLDEELKIITSLIEPIMLLVLGVLVGGIMISIITPIYKMIGDLGAR